MSRWRRYGTFGAAICALFALLAAPAFAAIDDELSADSAFNDSRIVDTTGTDSAAILAPEASIGDTVVLTSQKYIPDDDTLAVFPYLSQNYTAPPKRSPTNTMLKSVVFPGWGQYSNKKYIKAGVIFAVESYFIYKAVDFGVKAGDSRKLWKSLPDTQAAAKAEAFRKYASDRDNRNSNIWYTVIIAFLSMIDAYVDAHLQDFPKPVEPPSEVSLQLSPGNETRLSLVYQF